MSDSRALPTYDKSVALQVTAQPDTAGTASMLINSFRNFSESVASISSSISKEQATQQREILKNNISTSYRGFMLDALKNPDQNAALKGYTDASEQYAKGLMQQTDSYNRPYVANLTDYYHNEHMYTIEKNAILQNKRAASVASYSRINTATMDWKDAINNSVPMVGEDGEDHQFDAAKALFATTVKNMQTDAVTGGIRPERMGVAVSNMTKDFTNAMFLKRYQDHVEAGQGNAYIKELQKSNYNIPGYDAEDKSKLIGQMIKIRDQGRSAAGIAIGQVKQQMSDEVKRVAAGGMPNVELQENVKQLDENTYNKLMEDTNVAQHVHSATQAASLKTPQEVQQLKDSLLKIDPNDAEYGHLRRTADASIKAIDLQTKMFQQDPMTETMKNPAIQEAVNTYEQSLNVGGVGTDHMNTPFNSQVPKPWNSIIQAQLARGLTINGTGANHGSAGTRVRLLQNSQVPEIVNNMMQANPKQKIELMNKLNEEYGGGLPYNLVVKQLVDGGMPAQFALLANIDPNSKDATDVAEAVSIPYKTLSAELGKKDKSSVTEINKLSSADVFNLDRTLVETLRGVSPHRSGTDSFQSFMNTTTRHSGDVDREYFNSIATTVQQLGYYYALTQNMDSTEAVQKAENVVANRYDYAVLNNNEIRIPKDTTSAIVTSYAHKLEPQVDTFPWNTKGYDKDYAKELIKQGHWKNDSADHGLVWVDANGKLWSDANGHPLSFSFDEAKTGVRHIDTPPTTEINQNQDDLADTGETNTPTAAIDEAANIDRIGEKKIAQAKLAAQNRSPEMKAAIRGGS